MYKYSKVAKVAVVVSLSKISPKYMYMCLARSHPHSSPQPAVLVVSPLPDSGAVGRHRTGLHHTGATGGEYLERRVGQRGAGKGAEEKEEGRDSIHKLTYSIEKDSECEISKSTLPSLLTLSCEFIHSKGVPLMCVQLQTMVF